MPLDLAAYFPVAGVTRRGAACLGALVLLAAPSFAAAQTVLVPGFAMQEVVAGLTNPMSVTVGDDGLVYVGEGGAAGAGRVVQINPTNPIPVLYAAGFVGFFFNVILLMGLCSIVIVGTNPDFFEGGTVGGKIIGGGNMVAMHLAKAVGGDLLLGFLAAVAFATILAVVSGLALAGASAISHDLYARVIKKGNVSEAQEIKVSKMASFGIGLIAVVLGIAFEKQNVAFMAALAFGIAAAGNFPVLFLSMYWKDLTTRGALAAGYGGLTAAVVLVVLSKSVWVTVFGYATPIFPYDQPALFAMPLAFLLGYVFSITDKSPRAAKEREAYADQWVRAQTGFGADGAVSH